MRSYYATWVIILVSLAYEVTAHKTTVQWKDKVKAKPSARTRGALGQGFDIAKIDLLGKELQASGATIFDSLPYDKCTLTDRVGSTSKDDKSFTDNESIYNAIASSTNISPSLRGPFSLGASVSAVTNNIASEKTEVSGACLTMEAVSMSEALCQDCINNQPLSKVLIKDFKALDREIKLPWLRNSWRRYEVFLGKYGSHFVKEAKSGSSIYEYTFSKSTEKCTQRDLQVKACLSLAGPINVGALGISACSDISKEDKESASKKSAEKKLVIRGGKAETRADLSGELKPEQINKFMKEGETDPSPIGYSFEPIWKILKGRYSWSCSDNNDN